MSKTSVPHSVSKHFVSKANRSKGALEEVYKLFRAQESTDDETLVDIKVSNPLKRIISLIKDIKKRQATTFSMKFTIPLVALPVFLFAAFQMGKFDTACAPELTTKYGLIKSISVDVPDESTGFIDDVFTIFSFYPKVKSGIELEPQERTLLIDRDGDILNVLHTGRISLKDYENRYVLLTGNYSACSAVITLESQANVTIL